MQIRSRDVVIRFGVLVICLLMCRRSNAIYVFDEGSFGITQQAPTPGWSHVGEVNGGSGIYLGNGFVIVPSHVGVGSLDLFTWDGSTQARQTFMVDTTYPSCSVQNPSDPMSVWGISNSITTNTDLVVFKLATNPALPSLVIPSMAFDASVNETVTLISTGRVANPALGATIGPSIGPGTNRLRWGQNQVTLTSAGGTLVLANSGDGDVLSFSTTFDDPSGAGSGIATEAQAQDGDSGGAVYRDGESTLLGVIHAVSGDPNDPSFGDETFVASLPHYLDFGADPNNSITSCMNVTPVPEANTAYWAGLSLLCYTGVRWRNATRLLQNSECEQGTEP